MRLLFVFLLFFQSALFAGSISGIVRQAGAPLANVAIQARDIDGGCVVARTVSNAQGFYAMAVIPEASFIIEYALPGGRVRFLGDDTQRNLNQAQVIFVSAAGTNVNIDLEGGGAIGGRFEITGGRFEQAEVFLLDPTTLAPISKARNILDPSLNGFFQAGLEPGAYVIAASFPTGTADDRALYYYPGTRDPSLATRIEVQNRETRNDLEFAIDVSDWATVVLQPNFQNTSLQNLVGTAAELLLEDAFGLKRAISLTEQGNTFLNLPPGVYRARLDFEHGFLPLELGNLELEPRDFQLIELPLENGNTLSGSFNIATPALDSSVTLEVLDADQMTLVARLRQQVAGDFAISGLPPGRYRLRPRVVLPQPTRAQSVLAFPEATGPLQTLPEIYDLTTANTIPNISIMATRGNTIIGSPRQQDLPLPSRFTRINAYGQSGEAFYQTVFDFELNTFTLPGLRDGTYRLVAGVDQDVRLTPPSLPERFSGVLDPRCLNLLPTLSSEVVLAGGTVTQGFEFQTEQGNTIEMRVRGNQGTPIQNGTVYVLREGRLLGQWRVVGGHLALGGLQPGSYQLAFDPGQFLPVNPMQLQQLQNPLNGPDLVYRELQVGDAEHEVAADWIIDLTPFGEPEPEGAANFSGVRQLVYPWVSNNPQFESWISAQNLTNNPITATFTAIRGDGTFARTTRDIAAGGFISGLASEWFSELGQGEGYCVIMDAPVREVQGRWVTYNRETPSGSQQSPSMGVAVTVPAVGEAFNDLMGSAVSYNWLPTAAPWRSAPVLVNLGATPIDVDLIFYNAVGQLLSSQTLEDLQPYQPFTELTNDLVSTEEDVFLIARSTGFAPITGVSFAFNTSGEPAIGNVSGVNLSASEDGVRQQFYPWASRQPTGFNSSLILNNYAERPVQFQVQAILNAEESFTQTLSLAARAFSRRSLQDLFPQLQPGSGLSLRIQADTTRYGSQLLTANQAIGASPALSNPATINDGIPAPPRAGRTLNFGQVPLSQGFNAALVLVNLGTAPQELRLLIRDGQGNPIEGATERIVEVPPGVPQAVMVRDLISNFEGDVSILTQMAFFSTTGSLFVFNDVGEPAIGNALSVVDTVFPEPEPEPEPETEQ